MEGGPRHVYLPPVTLVCVGLYGSASTWLYNACRRVLACDSRELRIASFFSDRPLSEDGGTPGAPSPFATPGWDAAVVKMHEGSAEALELINSEGVQVLITIRDPRDCLISVMDRFGWRFETALDRIEASLRLVDRVLQVPGALILRYEEGFMREVGTLQRIARCLARDLDEETSSRLFAELTPARIDGLTRDYSANDETLGTNPAGRLFHRISHWHQGHCGDGAIGKWRYSLRPAQEALVRARIWREITRLGYAGHGR